MHREADLAISCSLGGANSGTALDDHSPGRGFGQISACVIVGSGWTVTRAELTVKHQPRCSMAADCGLIAPIRPLALAFEYPG
jgi:hypothetical protein